MLDTAGKKACRLRFRVAGKGNNCGLRSKQMRQLLLSFVLLLGTNSLFPACALQGDEKSAEATVNNVDAIQAMAIANQWKWSKKGIKSYVTPREVVFKFSNGKVKRISLPEEKMVVAVAPYIKQTHE